jgi:hypothetical protein
MDSSQIEFENWLAECHSWLERTISEDPARFKVRARPTFTNFLVTPSKDPQLYPPEMRTRLAFSRHGKDLNDVEVTAVIECNNERVDPSQVWSGSHITPIFRMSYYKDGDDYGLALTFIKGRYEPSQQNQISNDSWMIDSNTSGSVSSSMEEGTTVSA